MIINRKIDEVFFYKNQITNLKDLDREMKLNQRSEKREDDMKEKEERIERKKKERNGEGRKG